MLEIVRSPYTQWYMIYQKVPPGTYGRLKDGFKFIEGYKTLQEAEEEAKKLNLPIEYHL